MNLEKAVNICAIIELISPQFGCHVALTGGCLYKDGERKDLDILFYRIRQKKEIDYDGLFSALSKIGFKKPEGFGWLFKSEYFGCPVDMFFPEEVGGGEYDPEYGRADNAEYKNPFDAIQPLIEGVEEA
jgi:hypothetical protein